jgi:hypothetical protein
MTVDPNEAVAALEAELSSGPRSVGTGPGASGVTRDVSFPSFSTRVDERVVANLGPVVVVEVELDMDVATYRFMNDPDNPDQRSPGEAVLDAMELVGIRRPDGTPDLGVQLGVGMDRDRVIVQGYIPTEETVATDGGLAMVGAETVLIALGAVGPFVGMARVLTDLGEEYTIKNNLDTATFDVGIYDDASAGATGDAVSDTSDLAALTTEPSDGNYARQSEAVSASDLSGNWGVDTDTDTVFDLTNTTGAADSWFVEVNFTAVDTSDGAGTDHLLCTGALSQEYDLSSLTQLTISSGGVGWTVN